jgi:hypothetical protein
MRARLAATAIVLVSVLAVPAGAGAHGFSASGSVFDEGQGLRGPGFPAASTYDATKNMHPMGFSERTGTTNSDLAFWGDRAYQGNYVGFRILDISSPAQPRQLLDYRDCAGNQGDVIIWDDILVRSWNSSAPAGATCDGQPVAQGFEGLHVFDVSNPADPDLVAEIETECGSHTATGVPDVENGRLLVYNSPSSGTCPGIDIVEVPLEDPASASYLRFEPAGRSCHDTGVILGDAMMAACAGGNGFTQWSLADSLEDPTLVRSVVVPATPPITIGHSASFSYDGGVLIFGHEPGGGTQPRCAATGTVLPGGTVQTDDHKSFFFYDTGDGTLLGKWVLPRPQTVTENCTLHNLNVVPTGKRDVLVHGSYQSGIGVLDFSNPAQAEEIAYADPAPLSETQLISGGDWSTYWYDGLIYESDITRGLMTWNLSDRAVAGSRKLRHLNPQTQELTLP